MKNWAELAQWHRLPVLSSFSGLPLLLPHQSIFGLPLFVSVWLATMASFSFAALISPQLMWTSVALPEVSSLPAQFIFDFLLS